MGVVLERWVEKPPEDYLEYTPLWVQIRKIPKNYYTKVMFNVAHPLHMFKVINLPEGGSIVIHYSYEKVQKRCFTFQSLNHDKDKCLITLRQRQEQSAIGRAKLGAEKAKVDVIDPY